MIGVADPWMLAWGIPLVLLAIARARRFPRTLPPAARRVAATLAVLGLAAGVLALARLEIGLSVDRLAVVFVVDQSRSVEGSSPLEGLGAALDAMDEEDRAGLVVFGAEAATEVAPSRRPELGAARASVVREATDIAAGLRRALADLPAGHGARLVLVSDGVQTRGDALEVAGLAAARGVPIDVVPIERAPAPEVAVEAVQAPAVAEPDQPVELRIVTRATQASRVRVRVRRDEALIATGEAEIREGADVLALRDIAPSGGVHRYEVSLEPLDAAADGSLDNNTGGALMRVSGRSRALILSNEPAEAQALEEAFVSAGIAVERRGPPGAPSDLAGFAAFDLVVLADLNARAFSPAAMEAAQRYARDLGGGLLMAGASDSFGLGGYAGTPIEDALPATFDLRRRRDRASLAMVIGIDYSGSMAVEVSPGRTKLDLANEAAARSASLLAPSDQVGVMHVDTAVAWTQPLAPVVDPSAIARRIRAVGPGGGGIFVDVTLGAGYAALRASRTQLKHLLLFSDGQDSEEMVDARRLVRAAARDSITTSVVSMGMGVDTPELEHLSRLGGGRFYIVEDMRQLPTIFTQETVAASRSAIVDEPFAARTGAPSEIRAGVDLASAPALGGYTIVEARRGATPVLMAADDDPLLLEHQHGVGRTAVFTTDVGGRFGRSWVGWSGYRALFGQLGRAIARPAERSDARVLVSRDSSGGHVRVEAIDADGRARNYLDLTASVAQPDGSLARVPLEQTAAGRYEARFAADAPGAYLASVTERSADEDGEPSSRLVGTAGFVRPRGEELRGDGTDEAFLARIAALSGGRVRGEAAGVFLDRPEPTATPVPLHRELLVVALLALLLSVATRRIAWRFGARARPLDVVADSPPAASVAAQRAAAEPSPEAAAQAPPASDAPPVVDASPQPEASPSEAPAEPSSLAETLLARRKKRRK